jgi:hypothetical protein
MSAGTKREVMQKLRRLYQSAGWEHKHKLINQAVTAFGYHRKAAIRALNAAPPGAPRRALGRPREFHAAELTAPLRAIWQAADYPCGTRLVAMMPAWVPAYESHEKSLAASVRDRLLAASARTLDRLLEPLRAQGRGRSLTRPGSLLRQQIPIRGSFWEEGKAGWLEVDTVALCGGSVAGDFVWMVDAVDYATTWVSVGAIWNRGQAATLAALQQMEQKLPFPLLGLDSDNGGEFINHHVLAWLQKRPRPVFMTRSRPYKKDDNAHVEQKNWTHIRQWFGYERYDNAEVVPLINELVSGPYCRLLNYFHASLKVEKKERQEGRIKRTYGPAQTPLARVAASPEVTPETKAWLVKDQAQCNPFALKLETTRLMKKIQARRRAR